MFHRYQISKKFPIHAGAGEEVRLKINWSKGNHNSVYRKNWQDSTLNRMSIKYEFREDWRKGRMSRFRAA